MQPSEIFSGHSHSFDTGIAKIVGIEAAILFNHIIYWIIFNASKRDAETIDDKFWMYETQKQMSDSLGYLSEDQVQRALKKLEDEGLIIKANHNKNKFDRTCWYTVFDQEIIVKGTGFKNKFTKPQNDGIKSASQRNSICLETDSHIQDNKQDNKHVVVVKEAPRLPSEIPKQAAFTKDDLYSQAIRLRKNWLTEEIEESWKIYSSTDPCIISDPMAYIAGIIEKNRNKKLTQSTKLSRNSTCFSNSQTLKKNPCHSRQNQNSEETMKKRPSTINANISAEDMKESPLAKLQSQLGLK